jgi:8-oxo-dGTP diphosphatase
MKQKNGAAVLIMSTDKILLFHRDNIPTIPSPDCWQLVGGGIEENETPEQALVREVNEEVSFDLNNFEFIAKIKGQFGENVWFYVAFVNKDQERLFKHGKGEGQEIGWFTIDEALKLKKTKRVTFLLGKYREVIEEMMRTKSVIDVKNIIFDTTWRRDR